MVARMEILRANRTKVVTLNGPNGDPTFLHRATVFMHNYLRMRIKDIPASRRDQDLYLSFVVAGHNNLVGFWLEEHPFPRNTSPTCSASSTIRPSSSMWTKGMPRREAGE